ncbi:MAG: hypothetical protein E6G79_19440 [Alphaproteobacteria bacterium]|nr:MAG: hypothetical protein E6G79_19440 [Alphaproteobacteria bacterium]
MARPAVAPYKIYLDAIGRGGGVGRCLGVIPGLAVGVGLAVAVGVAVGVALGVLVDAAVAVGVNVGVTVAVAVGVAVNVAVAVGVGLCSTVGVGVAVGVPKKWQAYTVTSSTRQPSLEPVVSLAMRQRNLEFAEGGTFTTVVMKPSECPLHALRPAMGLPRSVLIVRL